jgi:hypothetical protein
MIPAAFIILLVKYVNWMLQVREKIKNVVRLGVGHYGEI